MQSHRQGDWGGRGEKWELQADAQPERERQREQSRAETSSASDSICRLSDLSERSCWAAFLLVLSVKSGVAAVPLS